MLRLRKILLCDIIYYLILAIAFIYYLLSVNSNYRSFYNEIKNEKFVIVSIKHNVQREKTTLILKGKEKVLATIYKNEKEFFLGDKVIVSGTDIDIKNNTVDNTFNYKEYLNSNKIYKSIQITDIKVIEKTNNIFYKIKNILLSHANKLGKSKPYIYSLIFGDNSFIKEEVLNSYRKNGISHLFAISGLHISIFIMVIDKLLKKIIKEEKRQTIEILFLLFFMFITGFSMSAMRGSIFTILIIINKKYYFNVKPINLLLLTLSIIMFINPLNINNLGLKFSFIVSFFLIKYSKFINESKNKILTTSLISFIASLPIVVNNFYQVNLMTIIYNLIFVPLVSSIILPFTLLTYVFPFLNTLLYILVQFMEAISVFLSNFDLFCVNMCKLNAFYIFVYYMSIFFLFDKCKLKIIYILTILLVTINLRLFDNKDYVLIFDIGQGDSSLIYVNKKATIIDTGGLVMYNDNDYTYQIAKNKIIPYLKSKGIRRISNLVITHGDADHMAEALYIVKNYKVDQVIFNNNSYNFLESNLIKELEKKNIKYYKGIDQIDIGKEKMRFLNTGIYDNENDSSNVTYFKINNYKFLFMGDAGSKREEDILDKYDLNNIDFIKVGHHGSDTSSSKYFINKINPKNCLISVGKDNKYGHPKKSVLQILKNCNIYRTDKDGSIKIELNKNGYTIRTFPP